MKTNVICKIDAQGKHSFYLNVAGERYYLFQQNFYRGVNEYYKNGVSLDLAMSFAHSHKDNAIIRTMQKLPVYIRYIEKEYSITVFNKTAKRNAAHRRAQAA